MKKYRSVFREQQNKFVYHITQPKHISKIKKEGLSTSSISNIDHSGLKNKSYKDRLYLALDLESAYRIAQELGNFINYDSNRPIRFMYQIKIDWVNFLKDNKVRINKDPDFQPSNNSSYDFEGQGGVYIKKNIPKKYILKVSKVYLEDW